MVLTGGDADCRDCSLPDCGGIWIVWLGVNNEDRLF